MEVEKTNNKNKIIIALVLAVLVIGGYFYFGGNSMGDNVAIVNGKSISMSTYNTQLDSAIALYKSQGLDVTNVDNISRIKTEVLGGLIDNELVSQKILEAGIKVTPEEIEKQFQIILAQTGGVEGLNAELAKNNITEEQLRENISKQLTAQAYLSQNVDMGSITVSDDEVVQFYSNYSKTQKDSGQESVPTLEEIGTQIKQQIVLNKQQAMVKEFVASLRMGAKIETTTI